MYICFFYFSCTLHVYMFLLFQNVDDLTETYDNIVGDVLLSASVVAYLGPFILDYRQVCANYDPYIWEKVNCM